MKAIDTLIEDIEGVINSKTHVPDEENLKGFLKDNEDTIREFFIKNQKGTFTDENGQTRKSIRMSNIGLPNRLLWHEINYDGPLPEFKASDRLRFLYGSLIENLMLFLIQEAGHKIEDKQKEINVDGVKGHQDCTIDGEPVDIKSASGFAFGKFSVSQLRDKDPFGYIAQLSGYFEDHPTGTKRAHLFVVNKVNGEMRLVTFDDIDLINVKERIAKVRTFINEKVPPVEKCYEPVPVGKSGNLELAQNCYYCKYKRTCWKDANGGKGLRSFGYSMGEKLMVHVEKEPRVDESI